MAPSKRNTEINKKRTNGAKPTKNAKAHLKIKLDSLSSKPPKIDRKVSTQRKLELANEVAMEQLTKPSDTSPKTLPSPISKVKSPTNIVPGTSSDDEIKLTPKRKRKSRKLSEDSSSDNTLETKRNYLEQKSKRLRKSTLKALENFMTSPSKRKSSENVSLDESNLDLVQTKRPGPKSRTTPQANKTSPTVETPDQEIAVKKKIMKPRSVNKDKNAPKIIQQPIVVPQPIIIKSMKVEVAEPEINKAPQKRAPKRRPALKKTKIENAAKEANKVSKTASARKPREKTRAKFVSEQMKGIKLKVTRTNKPKDMNAKEIQAAAMMLESALTVNPAQVQTRSNSVNSIKSNLSWIRDISTDSLTSTITCVTVTNTDFVRFDNKFPVVKMEKNNYVNLKVDDKKIEDNNKVSEKVSSSSDSESDSSNSSESRFDQNQGDPNLNLSTSSLSPTQPGSESALDKTLLLCLEMDKLTNILKNYYSEMGKYMVGDDDDTETFSTILDTMILEKELVTNCENFNRMLCDKKSDTENPKDNDEEVTKNDTGLDTDETSYTGIQTSPVISQNKIPNTSVSVPSVSATLAENQSPKKSNDSSQSFASNYNFSYNDRVCEDDDALSLFAESLTGMVSSRRSSVSNTSGYEPYVPKPVQRSENANVRAIIHQPDRYIYRPTRIEELPQKTTKQNADSSSISKDNNVGSKKALAILQEGERLSTAGVSAKSPELKQANIQWWMPGANRIMNPVKSAIYKNYCFFFLASQCKITNNCMFHHTYIDENTVKSRMTLLNNKELIAEYCLTVKNNSLRRRYAKLFIEECKRREFTLLLFKIAIELGFKMLEWEDTALNVNALETTLLHLNTISLNEWENQLMFQYKGVTLCNALLTCISETQNFAQFKSAFVKLASFMLEKKISIDIETVIKILERVCILPCEDSIAKGILCLMKNTSSAIFDNPLAMSFEEHLADLESVKEEYLVAKNTALEGRQGSRHASPDTTSLMAPPTFNCSVPSESDVFHHMFKSPSNPAPKRFPPRTDQWRARGNYPLSARGRPARGRLNLTRAPNGRPNYRRRGPRS